MLFNSLDFLIFFPIVVLIYFIIPNKLKRIWLLAASYYFYMSWNAKYILLILFSTVITYFCGLLIEKTGRRQQKIILALSIVLNLAVLFFFKYFNFSLELLESAASLIHIRFKAPVFDIILPVGISFYTFQALGYSIDVYRKNIPAEKSFIKYALFVAFFPQLVAGPIERSKNLLGQLSDSKKPEFENIRKGLLLMLWGLFLKIVIADRAAVFVDTVYDQYLTYPGVYLLVATVLFAFQIYCDFYGYSIIAAGAARVLGIRLMENFDAPYLAGTVAEFWKRWHISLTSWFRDYLYIPMGGNRKGKLRKYINIMTVFLVSGLWHGADITYVIWGGLNGFYQIFAEVTSPVKEKLLRVLRIDRAKAGYRILSTAGVFALVDFSWIFFRARSFGEAKGVIKHMLIDWNPWVFTDGSLFKCGLDADNFILLIICIAVLCVADLFRYRKIRICDVILRQDYWFRWAVFTGACIFLLVFGIWGSTYNEANFIYFQF